MSEEQLKAFLEKVKADTSLQEKLKAAADATKPKAADANAVAAIAKEAGFSISADDLKKAQAIEISEEELEGVAGGILHTTLVTTVATLAPLVSRIATVCGPSCMDDSVTVGQI